MAEPPLICVIHGCTLPRNQAILDELLGLIETSRLGDALTACVVHTVPGQSARYETPVVPLLRSLAVLHPSAYVLYLHTKGVRRHGQAAAWRRYMTYFLIEHWGAAINELDVTPTVVAVGCDLLGTGATRHFSGNFWWARAAYLATRPPAPTTPDLHRAVEHWLLTAKTAALSLHQSNNDHYRRPYPRSAYALD